MSVHVNGRKPYLGSFGELKAELRRRGLFEKDTERVLLELAFHWAVTVGGLLLFALHEGVAVRVIATLLWATGLLGIGTNTHTSSHYATTRRKWINEALTFWGYSVTLGFSATYWWHKHVAVHHKNPNVIGVDDDIDLAPFFAITDRDRERATGLLRSYYGLQWVVLPLALGLNGFNIQRQGWIFLIRALRDPARRRFSHWLDLGCQGVHYALWVGLPMWFFSPANVVAFYFFRNTIMGYALFVAFAPAHFPAEAVCTLARGLGRDFLLKQTATSVNFRTGPLGRLVCSGVEYQIEHHLFFWISHTHYREASQLVEEFCRLHGYPYRRLGWPQALWKTLRVFYEPKRVEPALRSVGDGPGPIVEQRGGPVGPTCRGPRDEGWRLEAS